MASLSTAWWLAIQLDALRLLCSRMGGCRSCAVKYASHIAMPVNHDLFLDDNCEGVMAQGPVN